jgi:hypothetical protein
MRLSYRGNSYNLESVPVSMVESGITGRYRGQTFRFSHPRRVPVPQPILNLKYRGVAYQTTTTGGIETVPTATAQPVVSTAKSTYVKTSAIQSRRVLLNEVSRIHRQNIQRSLQHRLEVARAKGDQNLIYQLEQEMQHFI